MFRLSAAGSVSRAVNNLQMYLQKKRTVAVHCTRICKMESHSVFSKSTVMAFLRNATRRADPTLPPHDATRAIPNHHALLLCHRSAQPRAAAGEETDRRARC